MSCRAGLPFRGNRRGWRNGLTGTLWSSARANVNVLTPGRNNHRHKIGWMWPAGKQLCRERPEESQTEQRVEMCPGRFLVLSYIISKRRGRRLRKVILPLCSVLAKHSWSSRFCARLPSARDWGHSGAGPGRDHENGEGAVASYTWGEVQELKLCSLEKIQGNLNTQPENA